MSLRTSVLSLGALIALLMLKEVEVKNVRKIVRGKEFGVPIEEIRESLIVA